MALSALGFEMAVTVLMVGAAGWAVDWWLGSRPWGVLVGLLLGCGLGMMNLVRGALRAIDSPGTTPVKRTRSKK